MVQLNLYYCEMKDINCSGVKLQDIRLSQKWIRDETNCNNSTLN